MMRKIIIRIIFVGIFFFTIFCCGIYFCIEKEEKHQMEVVNEAFQKNIEYQYYYEKSNKQDQDTYKRMFYILKTFQKKVMIKDMKVNQIKKIYNDVLMDHPEIFYVNSSFRYIVKNHDIQIIPQYLFDQKEVKKYNQQIDHITQNMIQKTNQAKTGIDKMKIIYDELIETVSYQGGKNDQNILSALLDQKSVCAGYAKAYQYLLLKAGIKCTYMTGTTIQNHDSHAWVMVYLNDDYYYSDPTWGDIEDKNIKHHCYGCFLMNSEDMLRCYQPDDGYEKTKQIN